MTGATDQKTEWNLGETIAWIRTRDHDRLARMWEMSEFAAIAFALFETEQIRRRIIGTVAFDPAGRLRIAAGRENAASDYQPPGSSDAAPAETDPGNTAKHGSPSPAPTRGREQPGGSSPDELVTPDRILRDIMRRVEAGKVRMTMVSAAEVTIKRTPVSAREAQELELRITEEKAAPAIAWSRTQGATAGFSPWFSRTGVIRAWPGLSKRTAAVTGAILRHLREISTPERPLIKPEALKRCLVEVPNAYPEAFKRAWAQLETSRKRGRGKHGPRAR